MNILKSTCRTKPGLLIATIFCVALLSPQHAGAASKAEQLIVFVQPDVSTVAKSFQQDHLPQIRNLAQTMGVDIHVVDARKGSPSTVGITPLMVYQNHRGRSICQGRTTTPERIRNFIRTSRFVPQGKEPNRRENIAVWQDYPNLFQQAAAVKEDTVARIIKDPESGDSFDPVGKSTPQTSWESIGLSLPPAPTEKTAALTVSAEIPQHWILAKSGPDDPPMIQFRFPAPLDNYAGEVKSAKGEFSLSKNLTLNSAKGFIEIDTRTAITMGDPILDEAIRGSMLLYSKNFPTAGFVVENITGDGSALAYGRLSPASVTGIFTLKSKKIPLSSKTEFEPVIGEDGNPRLLIRGAFKIDLRVFNIEGADGPAPARHILLLDLNFILKERQTRN